MCKSDLYAQKDSLKFPLWKILLREFCREGQMAMDGAGEHTRGDLFCSQICQRKPLINDLPAITEGLQGSIYTLSKKEGKTVCCEYIQVSLKAWREKRYHKASAGATLADFLLSITKEPFAFLKEFHPFPSGNSPALISCDLTVHKILREEREKGGE